VHGLPPTGGALRRLQQGSRVRCSFSR
jgi:hypothetical protein